MNVLIACEMSGVVRRAFKARGHNAYSCDLEAALDNSPDHIQADALWVAGWKGWDLMIAHPPCTYLTRSGWHWVNAPDSSELPLKGAPRRLAAVKAAAFFRELLDAPIPRVALENPRPVPHVALPPCSQVIQPWMFGHGETKATCLWLKNLPPLMSSLLDCGRASRVHHESPGVRNGLTRQQRRSITYQGIAEAMAEQWGGSAAREAA